MPEEAAWRPSVPRGAPRVEPEASNIVEPEASNLIVLMGNRAVQIWVSGRVQGVGYRAFAASWAKRLGLAGYVRNLEDGRVHLQVEGEETAIEVFLGHLREGPRAARVSEVVADPLDPAASSRRRAMRYHDFSILS